MLTCGNCCKPYSSKKVHKVPLILKCGCTYCATCLHQLSLQCSSVQCPTCRAVTVIDRQVHIEDQLPPNIYLLGLVAAEELALSRIPKTHDVCSSWLQADIPLKSLHLRGKVEAPPLLLCEECLSSPAELSCPQCCACYCAPCNQIIHAASQALRRHTSLPVTQAYSRPEVCPLHPKEVIKYFCLDDEKLLCPECALNGDHSRHKTVGISQAASEIRPKLELLIADAEKVLRKTVKSIKLLRQQLPLMQESSRQEMEKPCMMMPRLHTALQLRELALCEQVAKAFDLYATPCIQAHSSLDQHKEKIRAVIKLAQHTLKDDFKLMKTATSLSSQLADVSNYPSNIDMGSIGDMSLALDEEVVFEWIHALGRLHTEDMLSPSLSSVSGQSCDYLGEGLPPRLPPPDLLSQRCKSASPAQRTPVKVETGRVIRSASPYVKTRRNPQTHGATPTKRLSPAKRQSATPSPSKQLRDTPLPVQPRDLVEVGVSHMEDPRELYVQEKKQLETLKDLQRNINKYCMENYCSLSEDELKEGVQCGAMFSQDGVWYRALLDNVMKGSYVTVHFIDYGNSEPLPPTSLCRLPPSLQVVPPLAARCSLYQLQPPGRNHDLAPPTWKPMALQCLRELLGGQVKMQVIERTQMGLLLVDFFNNLGHSVRDKLLSRGFAVPMETKDTVLTIPPPMTLGKGQQLQVCIPAAQTPWDFHAQIVTVDAQQELAQLEEELDKAYSCGHLCIMGMPVVNKWACAWFEDDDKVYRAKITSVSEFGVGVVYLDYGNTAIIPLNKLYQLPPHLMVVRTQAIQCRLWDVCPPDGEMTWSEDISDHFHSLVDDADVMLTVMGAGHPDNQPLPVQLQLRANGDNIAHLLVSNGKASWNTTVPEVKTTPPSPGLVATPTSPTTIAAIPVSPTIAVTPTPPNVATHTSLTASATPTQLTTSTLSASATPFTPTTLSALTTPPNVATPSLTIPSASATIPVCLPEVGETFLCRVVHVDSSHSFYLVHLEAPEVQELQSALSTLTMEEEVEEGGGEDRKWEVGQAALTRFEGQWHRVVYEGEGPSCEGYQVHYVDCGIHNLVSNLIPIPSALCALSAQGLHACLANTTTNTKPEEFCMAVYNKILMANVQEVTGDGILVVTLKDLTDQDKATQLPNHFLLST